MFKYPQITGVLRGFGMDKKGHELNRECTQTDANGEGTLEEGAHEKGKGTPGRGTLPTGAVVARAPREGMVKYLQITGLSWGFGPGRGLRDT